jgi:hypothetical protein
VARGHQIAIRYLHQKRLLHESKVRSTKALHEQTNIIVIRGAHNAQPRLGVQRQPDLFSIETVLSSEHMDTCRYAQTGTDTQIIIIIIIITHTHLAVKFSPFWVTAARVPARWIVSIHDRDRVVLSAVAAHQQYCMCFVGRHRRTNRQETNLPVTVATHNREASVSLPPERHISNADLPCAINRLTYSLSLCEIDRARM